jgi:signal transduction histidine kinase
MVYAISQSQKNLQDKIIAETQLKEIEKFNKILVEKEQRIKNQLDELQEAHIRLEKALYDNDESKKLIQSQLEKLKETDVKKNEFAAMISHELKTPLVPIMGYAELLKTPEMSMTAEQLECVNEIYANAERLESLVSDVLDVQKLSMRAMKFNKTKLDLREFFTKITRNYASLLSEKQIHLDVSSTNIIMDIDGCRLHQVFDNLIRNAVDFVPNDGMIEIGAKSQKNDVLFYVKDNGIGIPKEKQKDLFKKFYQIDTSVIRKHSGTGLGLTICSEIIEGLGGRIWVESEEGKGTTFYFTIPK